MDEGNGGDPMNPLFPISAVHKGDRIRQAISFGLISPDIHSILIRGPPGTGKSMTAKAMTGILPELSLEEALRYLHGETLPANITGWCAPSYEGLPLGLAKGAGGILKNHLPKGLRI